MIQVYLNLLLLVTYFVVVGAAPVKRQDYVNALDHLDLFYGTGGGNVFPGASRPFGMAKIGIDTGIDVMSGYSPKGNVTAISMMHESGTGGAPQYGVVAQLPFIEDKKNDKNHNYITRTGHDVADLGYYSFNTTEGIKAEIAALERAGLLLYTFPEGCSPKVLVDLSHCLHSNRRPYWNQKFVSANASINAGLTGYNGSLVFSGGWGEHTDWPIHFCVEFNVNASKASKSDDGDKTEKLLQKSDSKKLEVDGQKGKPTHLLFEWENTQNVTSKQGISHVSVEQACQNMKNELVDFDVQALRKQTEDIWQKEVFSKISITNYNDTLSGFIYNSLYGSHLLPTNKTGENNNWNDNSVNYDDWYTIWDTFRSLNPLFNIINRQRSSEMVQALVQSYKHDGWTPDGRSSNQNGRTQGGLNSDVIMADAYLKGIPNVNWDDAFAAMVKNAEVTPPNNRVDPVASDALNLQGRGALPDWLKYGYVTRHYTRSVSRTMDYAYDDYALSVVAKGLGNTTAYNKYLQRSSNWQNLWNKDYDDGHHDYKGFLQPRNADGSFNNTDYDPWSCDACYWWSDEYEGKPVEYGWLVPYDVQTLIDLTGGNDTFIKRLDDMYGLHGLQVVDVGNEPSFLTPYLYNYVNQQHRTVELVRWIVNNYFTTGPDGLPGNSDAGAFQLWLLFALSGVYPVAGTTTYLISSPFLPYIAFNLENGSKVEIVANGLSQDNIYVQSVKLNGQSHSQNWFEHKDLFDKGGKIEFELGSDPVVWESGPVPPSPGHVQK